MAKRPYASPLSAISILVCCLLTCTLVLESRDRLRVGGALVVVKFTAQYHPEAHRLLTNVGLAPAVCGGDKVHDNHEQALFMVVMDLVNEETVWKTYQGVPGCRRRYSDVKLCGYFSDSKPQKEHSHAYGLGADETGRRSVWHEHQCPGMEAVVVLTPTPWS